MLMASGQVESHQTSLDECEADVAEHQASYQAAGPQLCAQLHAVVT